MWAILAWAVTAWPGAWADEGGARGFRLQEEVRTFPSGLVVVLAPEQGHQAFGLSLTFEGGSAFDPPQRAGAAHLLEHLWLRGQVPGGRSLRDHARELGCEVSAWTNADDVGFELCCPAVALTPALAAIGAALHDPLRGVGPATLAREQDVIELEAARGGHFAEGDPLAAVLAALHAPDHPYGHLPIGRVADLRRTTLDDLHALWAGRFRPEHATLVLSGGFEVEAAQRALFTTLPPRYFHPALRSEHLAWYPLDEAGALGVWPVDPLQPPASLALSSLPVRRSEAPPAEEDWLAPDAPVQANVAEPRVGVAWVLPPFDPFALRFDERILGGAFAMLAASSVAGRQLPPLRCNVDLVRHATLLYCEAQTQGSEQVDARVAKAISALSVRGARAHELSEARGLRVAAWRTQHLWELERLGGAGGSRTRRLASYYHEGRTGPYLPATDELLQRSDLEAAYAWLREQVRPELARVVRLRPIERSETGEPVESAAPQESPGVEVARPAAVSELLPAERVRERSLPTGLRVVAVDHGAMPYVDVSLYVPVGAGSGPPGVDELVARSAAPQARSSGQIDTESVAIEQRQGWTSLTLRARSGDLPAAIDRLGVLLEGWSYHGSTHLDLLRGWRSARGLSPSRAEALSLAAAVAASEALPSWVGPAATLSDDGFAGLADYRTRDLRAHLESKWRPQRAVLLLVGADDADGMVEAAAARLFGWRPTSSPPLAWADAREWTATRQLILLDDPDATQVRISASCVSRHEVARPSAAVELLGELLRQLALRELRESTALSYAPVVAAEVGQGVVRFDLRLETVPARASVAAQRAVTLLERLSAVRVSPDEIERAAQRLTAGLPVRTQTREGLRASLAPWLLEGGTAEAWRRGEVHPARISADQLRLVAGRCLDEIAVVVQGPLSGFDEGALEGWRIVRPELPEIEAHAERSARHTVATRP
jgi:predicted Zn-dependent peptidase